MTFFPKLISCFSNLRIAVDWSFSTHEVMCQFLSKDNAELRLIPAHIFREGRKMGTDLTEQLHEQLIYVYLKRTI